MLDLLALAREREARLAIDSAALLSVRPRMRVDGDDRPALGTAVQALSVHLPASGMASAEARVVNWAAGKARHRFAFQDLRLGSSIEILLGEHASGAVFAGEITALEERYGDGAPQLVILAEDALHWLARRRAKPGVREPRPLAAVVRAIADDAGLQADVGIEVGSADWLQHNESDLAFLLRLLGPHDIPLRMQDGRLRARAEEADRTRSASTPERTRAASASSPTSTSSHGKCSHTATTSPPTPAPGQQRRARARAPGRSAATTLAELGWEGARHATPSRAPRPRPNRSRVARSAAMHDASSTARSLFSARPSWESGASSNSAGIAAARRTLPHRRVLASLRQHPGPVDTTARRTAGLDP